MYPVAPPDWFNYVGPNAWGFEYEQDPKSKMTLSKVLFSDDSGPMQGTPHDLRNRVKDEQLIFYVSGSATWLVQQRDAITEETVHTSSNG